MTESNFDHNVKPFPQEDGTIVLECACGWGATVQGWGSDYPNGVRDENGKKIGRKPEKMVESLTNAHQLSKLQWPYDKDPYNIQAPKPFYRKEDVEN